MKLELPPPFHLRDAVRDDADALFAIHRASMHDYVDQIWGWEDAWQEQDFRKDFNPPIDRQVICDDDVPIGWICLKSEPQSTFIASIELHPDYQGRGIGSSIFGQLIDHSEETGTPLRLQVFKINHRAHTLYQRLGFRETGQTEHHIQMKR